MDFTLSMHSPKDSGLQIAWLKSGTEIAGEIWRDLDLKPTIGSRRLMLSNWSLGTRAQSQMVGPEGKS